MFHHLCVCTPSEGQSSVAARHPPPKRSRPLHGRRRARRGASHTLRAQQGAHRRGKGRGGGRARPRGRRAHDARLAQRCAPATPRPPCCAGRPREREPEGICMPAGRLLGAWRVACSGCAPSALRGQLSAPRVSSRPLSPPCSLVRAGAAGCKHACVSGGWHMRRRARAAAAARAARRAGVGLQGGRRGAVAASPLRAPPPPLPNRMRCSAPPRESLWPADTGADGTRSRASHVALRCSPSPKGRLVAGACHTPPCTFSSFSPWRIFRRRRSPLKGFASASRPPKEQA